VPTEQAWCRPQSRSVALVVTLLLGVVAGAIRPSKLVLHQVPKVYVFGDSMLDVGSPDASNSVATRSPVLAIAVMAAPLLSYFLYL
jgi:hypothetical protein